MKIICRFDNQNDLDYIANKISDKISLDVAEFNLDTLEVLKKMPKSKGASTPSDKHDTKIHWVNMPEFKSKKIDAFHKVVFHTEKTIKELREIFEQGVTDKTKSIWFPKLIPGKNSKYRVLEGDVKNRYPIYVVSKNRSTDCSTSEYLSRMEVSHFVVVEPSDFNVYTLELSTRSKFAKVLEMDMDFKAQYDTFDDLGDTKSKGPGAARNFSWSHSMDNGHAWHWVFDDNANEGFHYLYQNNKIKSRSGAFFAAIEDFVDRYSNIAIAGLNYTKFAMEPSRMPAFNMNTRIYSFLLIRNDIPYEWRGRYNEDTDLSLRVLKDDWCTVQFNAFLAGKATTQKVKGGNTEEFYAEEGTLPKSQMIEDMHPDVARVSWKFNRWHHEVNYTGYKQKLALKEGVSLEDLPKVNNYGMKIIETEEGTTKGNKSDLEWLYEEALDEHTGNPEFYKY